MRLVVAGLAAAALGAMLLIAGCSSQASSSQVRQWDAELQRLQTEQDSLRSVANEIVKNDSLVQSLPPGDAVIRIPTSFVRSVIQQVLRDVASHVTLRLGGIKAHVQKSVKKLVTIGQFTVDVDVQEVVGKLEPQPPNLDFTRNRIAISLPVDVNEGYGKAQIHFVWDGKNVAGAACGDMDVTQKVSGNVIPSRYVVSGTLGLAMKQGQIVATPHFPETRVRIRVSPSKQSWAAVDSLLASKGGPCGWVLDKVNVPSILKRVTEDKGFNVKLPLANLKPFVIPAGVRDTLSVGKKTLSIETTSNVVRIDPGAILYSANVVLK